MKHNFAKLPGALALGSLLVGSLLTVAPQARAAKAQGVPVGIPVLLPPFIQNPAPLPFLQTVSPFNIIGFIQNATLDPACAASDPLCGGTVTVNGFTVVVPRNMILQMPAFGISWADLFRSAPAPYGPTQSGLAINDTPKPFSTYQINITGNRVIDATGDQYRAALIVISQDPANAGQGYINFIDYSPTLDGRPAEIWVGSTLNAKTGSRIRMNSPGGTYGTPDPLADTRFTADEGNPTMHSQTGYPMCLPRINPAIAVDSLCPQWNRPKDAFTGAFAQIFTMRPATPGPVGVLDGITHQTGYPNPLVKPDPFEQTPFEVGDSVVYSGTLVNDAPCVAGLPASSCQYISANTIVASLGIFTAPGSKPAYISIEAQTLGVGQSPNPLFPQEGVERLVLESFTTDSSQLVDMYAVDRNPVTGAASHRFYATADPFGPPVGGVKSRARIRTFIGNFLPPTREMAVASRTLTGGAAIDTILPNMMITANGLQAGYYLAPTFEYIFPENFVIGGPQVPQAFEGFPFIVNGSGPYAPQGISAASAAQSTTAVAGQLRPFPNTNAPPQGTGLGLTLLLPPVAKAGFPQTVTENSTVTLDGSGSSDPNVPALTINYTWSQSSGPAATLLNVNGPHPQFVAPLLPPGSTPVALTFQLAVCNGFTCSGVSTVTITEVAATTGPSVTLSVTPGQNVLPGTAVTLTGTGVNGTAPLAYTFVQTGFGGLPPVVLTAVGTTQARFTAPAPPAGTALPVSLAFKVTVRDAAGRSVTDTINIFVGADTITVTSVTFRISKSIMTLSVTDNVPNGAANITMTPLGITGLPVGPSIVLTYDPVVDSYSIGGVGVQVNPAPNTVRFTSSFGGTKTSPITLLR